MSLVSQIAAAADSSSVRVRYLACAGPSVSGASGDDVDVVFVRGAGCMRPVFRGERPRSLRGPQGLCVVPPGREYELQSGAPWELLSLSIAAARLEAFGGPRAGRLREGADRLGVGEPFLERLAATICRGFRAGCPPTAEFLDSLAGPIADHLVAGYIPEDGDATGALAPYRLHRVRTFIESNIHAPLPLSALAQVAGLSPFHFARSFRQATGETPHACVTRTRMEAAQRLLKETQLPLEAIAAKVGYRTHSHFSSAFRQALGMTPRQFRRGPR